MKLGLVATIILLLSATSAAAGDWLAVFVTEKEAMAVDLGSVTDQGGMKVVQAIVVHRDPKTFQGQNYDYELMSIEISCQRRSSVLGSMAFYDEFGAARGRDDNRSDERPIGENTTAWSIMQAVCVGFDRGDILSASVADFFRASRRILRKEV